MSKEKHKQEIWDIAKQYHKIGVPVGSAYRRTFQECQVDMNYEEVQVLAFLDQIDRLGKKGFSVLLSMLTEGEK